MPRTLPVLLAIAFALPAFADADAAARHPWAKFKPGSWAKIKTTTQISGEAMSEETKFTLGEVTADYYTLKIETSMGGNALPATESKIPLTAGLEPQWTWEEKGTEDLEVDGQKLKCTVKLGTSGDGKSTKQVWTAEVDGAPLVVKSELRLMVAGAARTEIRAVKKLAEVVKAGGKDVKCWMSESVLDEEGRKTETKFWESREVPGFAVKSESKSVSGSVTSTTTREVVEFEVK